MADDKKNKLVEEFSNEIDILQSKLNNIVSLLGDKMRNKLQDLTTDANTFVDKFEKGQNTVKELNNKLTAIQKESNKLSLNKLKLENDLARAQAQGNTLATDRVRKALYQNKLATQQLDSTQTLLIKLKQAAEEEAKITEEKRKQNDLTIQAKGKFKEMIKPLTEIFTVAGFLKTIVDAANQFDKASVNISKNLGYGEGKANSMARQLHAISISSGSTTFNFKNLVEASNDLNNTLGLVAEYSEDTLKTQIMLTKQFGLTGEEAAHIYEMSVLTGKSSEQVNKEMVKSFVATRNSAKVGANFKQTMAEASKVSGQLQANFKGNAPAIVEAIVKTKALGTTLEQTKKQGEALLDFESSLENELKAELLTGKQINLEKARYAALTGDQVTLTQELANQVGSLADFQNMNVLAQKSLAEAFGLSRDEVADMLIKQETFNKLGDVSKKSAQEQLEIAKQRGLSETDSLMVNLKQQATAEKTAAAFDNFKTAIAGVLDGLQPVLDIMASLSKHAWLVYTALGLMAGVSLAKTLGGIALMITSLMAANIEAITLQTILTSGAFLIGLPLLLGAAYGIYKSATSAAEPQQTQDGIAPSSKGPFTITDAYGATAITAKGDGLAVSPNINRESINKPMQPSFNTSAITDAIATLSNTVSGLINRPQATPQFALHVDGRQIGTVVGKQMETGTAQNIYTGYKIA
jgi:hypothetical protein